MKAHRHVSLFRLFLVYSTSTLLIEPYCSLFWGVPHFMEKMKACKARQLLEIFKKKKARKKIKARKAPKNMTARKKLGHASHVEKVKAHKARKK